MVARENYKRSAPKGARILAYAISYMKKVAITESREIAQVAFRLNNEYWKLSRVKINKTAVSGGLGY